MRRMMKVCIVLALIGATGRANAGTPATRAALLQGSQTQATWDALGAGGKAGSEGRGGLPRLGVQCCAPKRVSQ